MRSALNEQGDLVDILYALYHKEEIYRCPHCRDRLMFKRGHILSPHFSHLPGRRCLDYHTISEWHRDLQSLFIEGEQEKLIKLYVRDDQIPVHYRDLFEIGKIDKNISIIKRCADVLFNDHVIEIQHSGISAVEFQARNWFYIEAGYKVIWIFDMIDRFRKRNILRCNNVGILNKYHWRTPFHTLEYLNCSDDNITILFQFEENKTERFIFSSRDRRTSRINMRWFYTNTFPNDINEIVRYTKGVRFRKNPFLHPEEVGC